MLTDRYAAQFEEMLGRARAAGGELSAFWPIVGRHFAHAEKRLLVVGRATNQWGKHGLELARARQYSDVGAAGAVLDDPAYVRRSAFWAVAQESLEFLGVKRQATEAGPNGWMQSLAWSNLFKVAPVKGWNPDGRTRDLVRESCVELLKLEVAVMKPAVVLVLAGADWFEAFGAGLGIALGRPGGKYVDGVADAMGARWVVAKHPMKKPRTPFMDEVKAALKDVVSGT